MDVYFKDPDNPNNIIRYNIGGMKVYTNEVKQIKITNLDTVVSFSSFEIKLISERGVSYVSSWII